MVSGRRALLYSRERANELRGSRKLLRHVLGVIRKPSNQCEMLPAYSMPGHNTSRQYGPVPDAINGVFQCEEQRIGPATLAWR